MFIEIHAAGFPEIVIAGISVLAILGHNLWLVAKNEPDEIKIEVVTSDKFPESDSAVKTERIADFRAFTESGSIEITDYEVHAASLVASVKTQANLVALELSPHPIELEAGKFAGYIASEAAEESVAPQFVKDETHEPQRESYAKFAKVLIDNNAFGKVIGQKLEIVFESDPSRIETGEKLKIRVLFEGAPSGGLRVSVGAEGLNGGKYTAHARTDEHGSAELEISGSGLWFARTHFIRPHSDKTDFEWESFWASTTVRI